MSDETELYARLKLDVTDAEKELTTLAKQASAVSKDVMPLPKEASQSLKEMFSGEKGLGNLGKLARGATHGINGLTGSIAGMAGGVGKAAAALGIFAAIVTMIVKLLQGTDTMAAMSEKFTEVFDQLREVLSPIISLIGDIVITLLQIVQDILPVLQPFIDAIAFGLNILAKVLKILEPIINVLALAFQAIYEVIRAIVKVITFGIVDLGEVSGSTEARVIETDNIKKKANGGPIGAQVWGMNEQGNPEFLFNSGGLDTVVNSDMLQQAVYNGMSAALSRQGAGKMEVSVKEGVAAGPRELAQWILPSLKFLLGR